MRRDVVVPSPQYQFPINLILTQSGRAGGETRPDWDHASLARPDQYQTESRPVPSQPVQGPRTESEVRVLADLGPRTWSSVSQYWSRPRLLLGLYQYSITY